MEMVERHHHQPSSSYEYDVFLSFRGPDTRNGFTGHLHRELVNHGVHAFIDNEDLPKGDKIEQLLVAIEASQIFIPIFSKRFAESKWCLKEVAKMAELMKKEGETNGRTLLPVFYDVSTDDVKKQTGLYLEAFEKHRMKETPETVAEWKEALVEIGGRSGYDLKNEANGHEPTLIQIIRKEVVRRLRLAPLDVVDYPVGLDSRVIETIALLKAEAHDIVSVVGIHGIGGIGKTTIAKAVYNKLHHQFEKASCILDIGRRWKDASGQKEVKAQLISDVLGKELALDVHNVDHFIKNRLKMKKVLLVLDNIDHRDQLKALSGDRSWFKNGSKIIITTRDKHLLLKDLLEEQIFCPEVLDESDSLRLFSYHAFRGEVPNKELAEQIKEAVDACGGVPLALEVYGSAFIGFTTKKEWEDKLQILRTDPSNDVMKTLKLSYDSLNDREQSIFLDIACFDDVIEKFPEFAEYMWEECGFYPVISVRVLLHKSLIKKKEYGPGYTMHELLRDLGKLIVLQKDKKNPSMRSRLYQEEDIEDLLIDGQVWFENYMIQLQSCFLSFHTEGTPSDFSASYLA